MEETFLIIDYILILTKFYIQNFTAGTFLLKKKLFILNYTNNLFEIVNGSL